MELGDITLGLWQGSAYYGDARFGARVLQAPATHPPILALTYRSIDIYRVICSLSARDIPMTGESIKLDMSGLLRIIFAAEPNREDPIRVFSDWQFVRKRQSKRDTGHLTLIPRSIEGGYVEMLETAGFFAACSRLGI